MCTPPSTDIGNIASDMERWYTNHDDNHDHGSSAPIYPPFPAPYALGPPLILRPEAHHGPADHSDVFKLWEQVRADASMGISAISCHLPSSPISSINPILISPSRARASSESLLVELDDADADAEGESDSEMAESIAESVSSSEDDSDTDDSDEDDDYVRVARVIRRSSTPSPKTVKYSTRISSTPTPTTSTSTRTTPPSIESTRPCQSESPGKEFPSDNLEPSTLSERVKSRPRRSARAIKLELNLEAPPSPPMSPIKPLRTQRSTLSSAHRQQTPLVPSVPPSPAATEVVILDESSEGESELESVYRPSPPPSVRPARNAAGATRKRIASSEISDATRSGRDPKRRRSQNVVSQKRYRDKKKDLAQIDHLAMLELCQCVANLPNSPIKSAMQKIRLDVLRKYTAILDTRSADLVALRKAFGLM